MPVDEEEQLKKGVKVEAEHAGTIAKIKADPTLLDRPEEIFKSIAFEHLDEMSDYYDRLEDMEQSAKDERLKTCIIIGKNPAVANLIGKPEYERLKKMCDQYRHG